MKSSILLFTAAISVTIVVFLSCSPKPRSMSYYEFAHQSQEYYRQLGVGCSQLWIVSRWLEADKLTIDGNSLELPSIIRDLGPSHVTVWASGAAGDNVINQVTVRIGASRVGYGIIWCQVQGEDGVEIWQLSAVPGEAGSRLFSISDSDLRAFMKGSESGSSQL